MPWEAVILAGGAGERLWPLSRGARPKQLLRLFDGKSLLRLAYDRLAAVLPPDNLHVIADHRHMEAVAAELPELPPANLVGEPCGRDTANAVGLAAALLDRKDRHVVMGVFPADQIIWPAQRFQETVRRGFRMAEENPHALITFGIRPTHPHTGYGYVQRGDALADGAFRVRQFKEKPDESMARHYVESGDYYWNSGMFVWPAATILDELARHLPASQAAVRHMAEVWDTPDGPHIAADLYPTLQRISIDFAVLEKAREVIVVEMDCQWLDVGSWPALAGVLEADAAGNVRALKNAVLLDSRNNVLVSETDHLIAAVGIEDLVVVHSPDATLICRREDAQRVKTLARQVHDDYGERFA